MSLCIIYTGYCLRQAPGYSTNNECLIPSFSSFIKQGKKDALGREEFNPFSDPGHMPWVYLSERLL